MFDHYLILASISNLKKRKKETSVRTR